MLILLSGLTSIGQDLYEAAANLGAGRLRAFFQITLPLLLPAISTVLLLRAIEMWKEFIFPFILAARFPLLATLIERAYHEWNSPFMASALSLVLVAVTLVSSALLYYGLSFLRRRITRE
jgi:ABC-type Fe3+ transport system permease subunit